MSKLWLVTLAIVATVVQAIAVAAQQFPPQRITVLVGYSAGGSTDAVARIVAERIGARLGTTIVVENREGAGGTIAAQAVARSPKDGSALLFAAANEVTVLPALSRKIPYEVRTAFEPVSLVGTFPFVLLVHPSLPVSNVSELVQLAKKEPGKLNYASVGGVGTTSHLASELFKAVTGTDIVHVPYKGGAAAMPDLLTGRVQMMFHAPQVAFPYIQSGALRGIAFTGETRSPLIPNVPTMGESGYPEIVVGSWLGLLAPGGTPASVVNRLDREVQAMMSTPEALALLQSQGTVPAYKPSTGFIQFIDAEMKRWADLASKAGIRMD